MSKQSGITMLSLIIYVLAMTVVVSTVATITSFFYSNVNDLQEGSSNISELAKFNMYFLNDINRKNNQVSYINENNTSITFLTGNTYTFNSGAIYYNNICICENVKDMQITVDEKEEKKLINVDITLGDKVNFQKKITYVM